METDSLGKTKLEEMLADELAGIRRPPALMCSSLDVNLEGYEISQLEPLHDLKSTISIFYDNCPK